jgi:hypothetical protein
MANEETITVLLLCEEEKVTSKANMSGFTLHGEHMMLMENSEHCFASCS